MITIDIISKNIKETGKLLISDKSEGTKRASTLISELKQLTNKLDDPKICFNSFFLHTFLEDVFYNIIGDFPYHESWGKEIDNIRNDILNDIGENFLEISKEMKLNNFSNCIKIYENLVFKYLKKIKKLNDVLNSNASLQK